MSERNRFKTARQWRITDKATLVMLLAAVIPLLVADFQLIRQEGRMRGHLETTLKDFSDRTTVELVGISGQDARTLVRETAGQAVKRAEAFFQSAAVQTRILAGLMTGIYSNPSRYGPRAISEPEIDQTGLAAQLTYSPNVPDRRDLRDEISLAANIQEFMLRLAENFPSLNAVAAASANGFTIEADRFSALKYENSRLKGLEARERPWYVKAWAQGGLVVTDVDDRGFGGGPSVWLAAPFYLAGDFAGVAALNYSLADINALVRETRLSASGFAFTVNDSGQVTVSPRPQGVLSVPALGPGPDLRQAPNNPGLAALVSRMAAEQKGETQVNIDGREYLVVFEPLPTIHWSLAVAIDMEEVLTPARRTGETLDRLAMIGRGYINSEQRSGMIILLLWHLAVIGAVILASRYLARRLTRAVAVISAWAGQLGQGHLETPLKVSTGDEIENLAENLDQMRRGLTEQIEREVRARVERERLEAEFGVARKAQRGLLPRPWTPGEEGLDLAGEVLPWRQVGGDFYDWFPLGPGRLALVMADSSDRGARGVMFMALIKSLIRVRSQGGSSPAWVLTQVGASLTDDRNTGLFASVFLGFLDLADGRLVYANAGHRPPLISGGGAFERLSLTPGLVLGPRPDYAYGETQVILPPGSRLLFYSDGVVETHNPQGELFSEAGLKKCLVQALKLNPTAAELVRDVEREVRIFARGTEPSDDLTLMALHYQGVIREI